MTVRLNLNRSWTRAAKGAADRGEHRQAVGAFALLLASRDGPISAVGPSIYRPGSERRSRRLGPADSAPVDRKS
jgi:hypothetical protein